MCYFSQRHSDLDIHMHILQSSSVLHLPLVTAMTGQVKVSVLTLVLTPDQSEHGGLQDVQGIIKLRMVRQK